MKRKRSRPDAIAFRMRHGEEVLALANRLGSGRYRPGPGSVFVTSHPKPREIHAAAFRDRVVHHLLHQWLEPRFERRFIADSFACRRGKGTHAAAKRLQEHLRRATRQGQVRGWALKLDVRNFFNSIHKPTLLGLLAKGFTTEERAAPEPSVWALTRTLVLHDPCAQARREGSAADFARVPKGKRLGALGSEHGLPIGNLTSQFFANVYLDALDQFVKRTLGVRHYVRYVDDFVLVDGDPERLRAWEERIRHFLRERLRLEAHAGAELRPASDGVDFVGYVVRPGYLLPRRRVVRSMETKLREAEAPLAPVDVPPGRGCVLRPVGRVVGPCSVQRIDLPAIDRLFAVWSSYRGHLAHAEAFRLLARLRLRHPVSAALLAERNGVPGRRFLAPRPEVGLRSQVRRLRQGIGDAVLLVKVGRFAECLYRADARRLGLKWGRRGRRRGAGVPWACVGALLNRALRRGLKVAVAVELPLAEGNVKARRLAFLVSPQDPLRMRSPGERRVPLRIMEGPTK